MHSSFQLINTVKLYSKEKRVTNNNNKNECHRFEHLPCRLRDKMKKFTLPPIC